MVRKYIVSFPPDVNPMVMDDAITALQSKGAKITHRYEKVINGFAVEMPEVSDFGIEQMKALEGVESVEDDGEVRINA